MTREKLTKLRNVRILNQYKEASAKSQIFTCMFCIYWVCNMALGLYIINEYGSYLETSYPELEEAV